MVGLTFDDIVSVVPLAQLLGPSGCALIRMVTSRFASTTHWSTGDKPRLSLSEIILHFGVRRSRGRDDDDELGPTAEKRLKEVARFQHHLTLDEIVKFVHCNAEVRERPFDEWDAYEITPYHVYPPICACLMRWRLKTPLGLINWLVEKKADINASVTLPMLILGIRSNYLTVVTPLVIATYLGNLHIAQKLVDMGADCWIDLIKASTSRKHCEEVG
eukprot:GEMP01083453.1.p1 GENE.GEMP01083453.1~~GEMP01083453.1.p1  ORF type:complete len:217 (+),score=35.99 GEMP01083453.1:167-817(+)